jgi:hypothetical protein
MRAAPVFCAPLAALALSACSLAPGGGQIEALVTKAVDTAIQDRRAFNDKKADTLLTLPCDISIGAYYRLQNGVQQEALSMLCSGKRAGEPDPTLEVNPLTAPPEVPIEP